MNTSNTPYACPLDYRSIVKISGTDSEKFLQGQLSCDIREVSSKESRLAAHCNPKGSMLSLMRIYKINNDFIISVNSDNLQNTLSNLNKYMMFSKAESADLSDSWAGYGLWGEEAHAFIEQWMGDTPNETNQLSHNEHQFVTKVAQNRYEVWIKSDQANSFAGTISKECTLVSSQQWLKQDIVDAIPDIYPSSSATYIPQMCNLQALKGVSFQKGCYTGQEVIARLHFRGKLTKFLVTARTPINASDEKIEIGDNVHCADKQNVGQVLQYMYDTNHLYLQIIVSYKYFKEALFLENNNAIELLLQPYALDPELFTRKT